MVLVWWIIDDLPNWLNSPPVKCFYYMVLLGSWAKFKQFLENQASTMSVTRTALLGLVQNCTNDGSFKITEGYNKSNSWDIGITYINDKLLV